MRAADAGVDALIVQGSAAGGHSGTLTPDRPLPDLVTEIHYAVRLPIIAAGGLVDPADVAAVIAHGARTVAVGTALLLAPEAGTSAAHRQGLLDDAAAAPSSPARSPDDRRERSRTGSPTPTTTGLRPVTPPCTT